MTRRKVTFYINPEKRKWDGYMLWSGRNYINHFLLNHDEAKRIRRKYYPDAEIIKVKVISK